MKLLGIWPYRTRILYPKSGDALDLPREFASAIENLIPREYQDNHIVVLVHDWQGHDWYVWLHDFIARFVEVSDAILNVSDCNGSFIKL